MFRLSYANLKSKLSRLRQTNPALFLFLLTAIIGIGGFLLTLFDKGLLFNSKITTQSERSYDYKALRVYGSTSANVIGYKINFDKANLKFSSPTRGGHSIEEFIKETGACAAINVNFYHSDGKQLGLYNNNYNKCENCPSRGFVDTLFLKSPNAISNYSAKAGDYYFLNDVYWNSNETLPAGISNGTAGKIVLKDGKDQPVSSAASSYTYLGWDEEGEIYAFSFFPGSVALQVLAMKNNGIINAIMLDGGGSSQMYSESGTENDSTKKNVIPKTRRVPYYLGSGSCGGTASTIPTPTDASVENPTGVVTNQPEADLTEGQADTSPIPSSTGNNGNTNSAPNSSRSIMNNKLEYCSKDSSSKNCIPYARYYDEPMTELLSCQTIGTDTKKTLDKMIELNYDAATNSYVGQAVLAGRIRNFPMLRHFGSSNFGEYGGISSIDPTTEGTLYNPYQPVCSFLSETFSKNGVSMYMTHEFEGKVIFYDTHGNSYEYGMPRLGNGLGCVNLLSSKLALTSLTGSLENDFSGFTIQGMSTQERKIAACKSKQAKLLQNRTEAGLSFADVVKLLKTDPECQNITPDDSDTYDTEIIANGSGNIFDKKEQEAPVFEYDENQRYCTDSDTYGGQIIRNINTGSNSITESYRGPGRALRVENIKIDLSKECNKSTNLFLLRSQYGASLKDIVCNGNTNTKAYLPVSIEIPTYIGIPGGVSAYSILTEYLQSVAENKVGKILTPPNGVKIYSEFSLIGGNGNTEIGDTLNFKKEEGDPTIEYVVPYLDYQPLFVALQYVLNNENESTIETNK